jgi:hypothetical protein
MTTPTHTPADELRLYSDSLICCNQDGVSDHFCQVSHRVAPGEQAANARFIFHACKSFEENQALIAAQAAEIEWLRAKLKEISDQCNQGSPDAIHESMTIGEWNTERVRRIKLIACAVPQPQESK